ncbi:hypothetical protein Fcan01_26561 [Folsomia candida]|uniref:Uncharacterized protein n=1 Tax=Folsomia candida TaxID=158441 RepID=A0A226D0U3_FOLCA|nr:hypothetical protein Fcan01_26561 [Folsomia candida]
MLFLNRSRLLQSLLLHIIFTNAVAGKEVQSKQITIPRKFAEYLLPFENCTTMIYTPTNFSLISLTGLTVGPIVILNYQMYRSSRATGTMFDKFALKQRRNSAPHCWATFAILPEQSGLLASIRPFIVHSCFVDSTWESQYFIWVTTNPIDVHEYLNDKIVLDNFGLRDVLIVDVKSLMEKSQLLRFRYHNLYHIETPPIGIEHSKPWYTIDCVHQHCFNELGMISKNVSKLNKYFWSSPYQFTTSILTPSYFSGRMDLSFHGFRKIVNLTTLNGFLSFLILQDMWALELANVTAQHRIPFIRRLALINRRGFTFTLYEYQSYSFVSCYNVKSSFDLVSALLSPFDTASWTWLAISFTTVVTIVTAFRTKFVSDGLYLMVGISLENSVLLSRAIYEARFGREKHYLLGLYTIVAVWILLVGTILANWYKTWFTMEMIIPTKFQSPWDSVFDVKGIQILMPFLLLQTYDRDLLPPRVAHYRYKYFYMQILFRCKEIMSEGTKYERLVQYSRTARSLFEGLIHHFGYDENLNIVGNGMFTGWPENPPAYNKSALQDFPIQPVEYNREDSYEIFKTLLSCGKVALLDTKENIVRMTSYLNDNDKKITFVSGHGDSFFSTFTGWVWLPVRESYAEKRLKVMISSGIWAHWNSLYKLWHLEKQLDHYANWTHPKVEAVSKLDFGSKIITGFYVYGVCLVLCILALFGEILRHNFLVRVIWWIHKLSVGVTSQIVYLHIQNTFKSLLVTTNHSFKMLL